MRFGPIRALPRICLQGMGSASLRAQIWTRDFPYTKQERANHSTKRFCVNGQINYVRSEVQMRCENAVVGFLCICSGQRSSEILCDQNKDYNTGVTLFSLTWQFFIILFQFTEDETSVFPPQQDTVEFQNGDRRRYPKHRRTNPRQQAVIIQGWELEQKRPTVAILNTSQFYLQVRHSFTKRVLVCGIHLSVTRTHCAWVAKSEQTITTCKMTSQKRSFWPEQNTQRIQQFFFFIQQKSGWPLTKAFSAEASSWLRLSGKLME
jgi:hypothetical protein